ncbi:MAG: hypothetical protein BWY10_02360 [Chloroflexi bacterium ADurb.Bin180]|jgi:SAM-dependent methyltransferase|nr:MAG: hypothetical protein BWY10_02360 [Chloroflexi bacterium ADurb.Bin180]
MSNPLLPPTESSAYPSGSRLRDPESRRTKARKILTVLHDAIKGDLRHLRCLDVGCASGLISYHLAEELGQVVGVDPDGAAVALAPQRDNLFLLQADALRLPFLHWLPLSWASWIVRCIGKGQAYDEKPLTCGQLKEVLRGFAIEDYTIAMLRDPDRFFTRNEVPLARLVRHIPVAVWRLLYSLLPNHNWVLRKDKSA